MKLFNSLLFKNKIGIKPAALFLIFFLTGCKDIVDSPPDNSVILNCDNLRSAVININSEIVEAEINKLTGDLFPRKPDEEGNQSENISLLISRINQSCDEISAELSCYACIETYPPQSEIIITTDSIGIPIKRIIDILTPSDNILKCVGIHK